MDDDILDLDITNESTGKKVIPNDNSILIMGIIALPFSFGLIGIVLGILTLISASKSIKIYKTNPSSYLSSSLRKVIAGRACGIIALSIFGVIFLLGFLGFRF